MPQILRYQSTYWWLDALWINVGGHSLSSKFTLPDFCFQTIEENRVDGYEIDNFDKKPWIMYYTDI